MTPHIPRLPTISLGRSNPAAFLTTLPPPRMTRPRPSIMRTSMTKSRTPPKRSRPGPAALAATVPPNVAPDSTQSGSKGRYCPFSASVALISFKGVPAWAVMVYSDAWYSVIPESRRMSNRCVCSSVELSRDLVPAPTGSSRSCDLTASITSDSEVGSLTRNNTGLF